jgi:hypothetical protein
LFYELFKLLVGFAEVFQDALPFLFKDQGMGKDRMRSEKNGKDRMGSEMNPGRTHDVQERTKRDKKNI